MNKNILLLLSGTVQLFEIRILVIYNNIRRFFTKKTNML